MWQPEAEAGSLPSSLSTLGFEKGSLTGPGASHFNQTGWTAGSTDRLHLHPVPSTGIAAIAPGIYLHLGDLKIGAHAYTASALPFRLSHLSALDPSFKCFHSSFKF